ncbi:ABC transporter ATP-binding protein [Streptomyces sp. BE230]|uniref:ABC transporter ATP-binding protein n=1 Tax=Streptomyces sp. BE230 TaxID=3002526 RepID=UPI002ED2EABB
MWRDLIVLSYHRTPWLMLGMFVAQAANVGAVAAVALSLRSAVDSSAHGTVLPVAVLGAACGYGLTAVLGAVRGNLHILLVERVGITDLHQRIQLDIAGISGLEHLESTDYLDRVEIVRESAWGIVNGLWSAVDAFFNTLQIAVSLVLLGGLDPWMLGLLPAAAAPLWFDRQGHKAVNRAEVASAGAFRLQRHLFDVAVSASEGKEIRVAGAGAELARLQDAAWTEAQSLRIRAQIRAACWKFGGWSVFSGAFLAGLALVIQMTQHGDGSVGDVVLMVTVASSLRQAVFAAVSRAADTAGASRLIEPYLWLRRYARANDGRTPERPPARLTEGVRFDAVSFSYEGVSRPALDEISAFVPAGSVVAVVGEYGSGKSTLVKLLAKFYSPVSGAITVDGVDLQSVGTDAWRERLSAAFQDFGRFEVSVRECIGLGEPARIEDEDRVREAAAFADADGILARLPAGLETQLGRKFGGVEFSEGQWQKMALARASMRRDPLLFILDEPTASLDAPSEHAIFQRYMDRAATLAAENGTITFIVSHRFSTVSGADLIMVLDQGRLVEIGGHEELLAQGGRYADLYSIQQVAYSRDSVSWPASLPIPDSGRSGESDRRVTPTACAPTQRPALPATTTTAGRKIEE